MVALFKTYRLNAAKYAARHFSPLFQADDRQSHMRGDLVQSWGFLGAAVAARSSPADY